MLRDYRDDRLRRRVTQLGFCSTISRGRRFRTVFISDFIFGVGGGNDTETDRRVGSKLNVIIFREDKLSLRDDGRKRMENCYKVITI